MNKVVKRLAGVSVLLYVACIVLLGTLKLATSSLERLTRLRPILPEK